MATKMTYLSMKITPGNKVCRYVLVHLPCKVFFRHTREL